MKSNRLQNSVVRSIMRNVASNTPISILTAAGNPLGSLAYGGDAPVDEETEAIRFPARMTHMTRYLRVVRTAPSRKADIAAHDI